MGSARRRRALAIFPLALAASCAQAAGIVVDGSMGRAEWAAATRHQRDDVVLSRLADQQALYLAVEPRLAYPAYVDLYLADEKGEVVNLHASMKVGQRSFRIQATEASRPAFAWGRFPHWQANVGDPESNRNVYEFRIERATFGGRAMRLRVEVQDFHGRNQPVVFPPESSPHSAAGWIALPR